MPLDQTTVTGTVYTVGGAVAAGVGIYVKRVIKSGTLIQSRTMLVATSGQDGTVSFTVPRNSTAYIHAAAEGLDTYPKEGVALTIPDAPTATLESLISVSSVPATGATVQDDGVALATLIGMFNFGAGITVVQSSSGVALITADIATAEAVQDALASFFPDSAPFDWTVDDAGNRVQLDIAVATTLLKGLMSASDKSKLDGVATGATANSSDATLLARANHTGSQAISTVSGLQTALDDKAPLASPALTGTPTVPTATPGTNTTQISSTAFVQAALAALINSAPGALDTLDELAAAFGDDPNFAATVTTALATKVAKASNLSDLVDAAAARGNLGLGSAATKNSTPTTNAAAKFDASGNLVASQISDDGSVVDVGPSLRMSNAPSSAQFELDGDGNLTITVTDASDTPTERVEFLQDGGYTIYTPLAYYIVGDPDEIGNGVRFVVGDSNNTIQMNVPSGVVNIGSNDTALYVNSSTNAITLQSADKIELNAAGSILLIGLPTSNPNVAGALWSDGGTLRVSAG